MATKGKGKPAMKSGPAAVRRFEKADMAADRKAGIKEGSPRDMKQDRTRARQMGVKLPRGYKG